jgi:hypothetical protein
MMHHYTSCVARTVVQWLLLLVFFPFMHFQSLETVGQAASQSHSHGNNW